MMSVAVAAQKYVYYAIEMIYWVAFFLILLFFFDKFN